MTDAQLDLFNKRVPSLIYQKAYDMTEEEAFAFREKLVQVSKPEPKKRKHSPAAALAAIARNGQARLEEPDEPPVSEHTPKGHPRRLYKVRYWYTSQGGELLAFDGPTTASSARADSDCSKASPRATVMVREGALGEDAHWNYQRSSSGKCFIAHARVVRLPSQGDENGRTHFQEPG